MSPHLHWFLRESATARHVDEWLVALGALAFSAVVVLAVVLP